MYIYIYISHLDLPVFPELTNSPSWLKLKTQPKKTCTSFNRGLFFSLPWRKSGETNGFLKRWGTGDPAAWPLVSSSAASKAFSASLRASFLRSMLRRAITKQPGNGNGKSWWKKMCVYTCVYICICMFNVHVYYIYTACTVHMHVYVTCQILGCRWSDRQNEDFGFGEGLGNCA